MPLSISLDSELAVYFIERYLNNGADDNKKDALIRSYLADIKSLDPVQIKQITRATSHDFTALLIAETLLEKPQNKHAQKLFAQWYQVFSKKPRGHHRQVINLRDDIVLFIPGWHYKSDTTTGADFNQQRKLLSQHGIENHLIATKENGTIEENGQFVAREIASYSARYKNLILVSASKGGPETALALHLLKQKNAVHNVAAWVNVGGVLRGTVLADKAATFPWNWFAKLFVLRGKSLDGILSLKTTISSKRANSIGTIDSPLVINYVGIPMESHISDDAALGFRQMKDNGPNDGLTYIVDAIQDGENSVAIVEIGLDHYYKHQHIDIVTLALAYTAKQLSSGGSVSPSP